LTFGVAKTRGVISASYGPRCMTSYSSSGVIRSMATLPDSLVLFIGTSSQVSVTEIGQAQTAEHMFLSTNLVYSVFTLSERVSFGEISRAQALSFPSMIYPSAPDEIAAATTRTMTPRKANKINGVANKQFIPEFLHIAVKNPRMPVRRITPPVAKARIGMT